MTVLTRGETISLLSLTIKSFLNDSINPINWSSDLLKTPILQPLLFVYVDRHELGEHRLFDVFLPMHFHVGRTTKILYHLPVFLALGKLFKILYHLPAFLALGKLFYCEKIKMLPVLASLLTGKSNLSW